MDISTHFIFWSGPELHESLQIGNDKLHILATSLKAAVVPQHLIMLQ